VIPATARAAAGWRDDAACRGEDPALFFPADDESEPGRLAREASAKAVCADCAVRSACLDFAQTRPARHGLWGGLSEDERAAERRRRQRAARKPAAA
jgi:WhiB family redox-sensing transcriptional regulator